MESSDGASVENRRVASDGTSGTSGEEMAAPVDRKGTNEDLAAARARGRVGGLYGHVPDLKQLRNSHTPQKLERSRIHE